MRISGDITLDVNRWIEEGRIIAHGGTGEAMVLVAFDGLETTVSSYVPAKRLGLLVAD